MRIEYVWTLAGQAGRCVAGSMGRHRQHWSQVLQLGEMEEHGQNLAVVLEELG